MAVLLRILLMLIVIYYIISFITRAIPSLFYGDSDYRDRMSPGRDQQQKKAKKSEGEITIRYNPDKGRKTDKSSGEYIDYEEVKD